MKCDYGLVNGKKIGTVIVAWSMESSSGFHFCCWNGGKAASEEEEEL